MAGTGAEGGDTVAGADRFHLHSLDRGLLALEFLASQGSVRPADLAATLGVDRASAYRILRTLTRRGYAVAHPDDHAFAINPARLYDLTSDLSRSLRWPAVAQQFLARLHHSTGQTANLGMLDGGEVVYISQELSRGPVIVDLLGQRRPANCSALGKAILAWSPADAVPAGWRLVRLTDRSITDWPALSADLDQTRRRGYALDDGETFDGVRCVAAPIRDGSGSVVAALGISGPTTDLPDATLRGLAGDVVQCARAVAQALGYPRERLPATATAEPTAQEGAVDDQSS